MQIAEKPHNLPLRFPIQDVYRFDERRILAGRIESGTLRVGDRLVFSPRNKTSTVKSIECWNAPPRTEANAGESIGITLTEQIFVNRGQIASHEQDAPVETDVFNAKLFWLGRQNLEVGRKVKLKLTTEEIECQVQSIEKIIDASTLAEIDSSQRNYIARNDVAEVTIRTKSPIAFDQLRSHRPNRTLRDRRWQAGVRRRHHLERRIPRPPPIVVGHQEHEHFLDDR